jgi:hypothetical protein
LGEGEGGICEEEGKNVYAIMINIKFYSIVAELPNVTIVQEINWEENSNCFLYHPTFLHFHM